MILETVKFGKFLKFFESEICRIFEIANFYNFRNWKFLEFVELQFFGIFQINFFFNFSNRQFFEFSKLNFFGIFQIDNLWNFPKCRFLFSKCEIVEIVQIKKLTNFEIFFNSENQNSAPKISNFGIFRPFDVSH